MNLLILKRNNFGIKLVITIIIFIHKIKLNLQNIIYKQYSLDRIFTHDINYEPYKCKPIISKYYTYIKNKIKY